LTEKETILEEAQRLIHGERNKNYGHPRTNFRDISALFSAYLGIPITDLDVANLMILVKVARQKGSEYKRDNYTDIAGYAGCAERIYEEPEEGEKPKLGLILSPDFNPEARMWERFEHIPDDVEVEDNEGDWFIKHAGIPYRTAYDGEREEQEFVAHCYLDPDCDFSPYTEVVSV
jgi:hypothetical protein